MAKTTITQSAQQKDFKRGEKLMKAYAEFVKEQAELKAKHQEELAPVVASMKEAEKELLEIGARNKKAFDENGRLVFDHGYILKSHSTSIKAGSDFSWKKFFSKFPELVDFSFKTAKVKALFMDGDKRQALVDQDVDLKQVEELVVKIPQAKG